MNAHAIQELTQVERPENCLDQFLLRSMNPTMQRVMRLAEGVALAPTTVLLTGESGTGKEVTALHIHHASDRKDGPFIAVNCAAVPASLMESEFFGHEKGAFSGAGDLKKGKFELANGGTLLLDEVSELPLELQAKLLRVLQERRVCRVGGVRTMDLDVRVIAVTNRDLTKMVREGTFRQDLYYRINVFPIWVPPLRERREDIASLVDVILDRLVKQMGRSHATLRSDALKCLVQYDFPGNVRELQNLLERALILSPSGTITPDALLFDQGAVVIGEAHSPFVKSETRRDVSTITSFEGKTLAEIERQVILDTLQQVKGNRTQTSRILGISVRTLRNRLREYRGAGFPITQVGMECAA
jgi:two-component system response regulator FlrC